jgi:ABC-type polysaccharide/polyol phosphate transport system ATPase subunit
VQAAIELDRVHKRYRIYRERYRSVKEVLIHRRFGEWEDRWALRGVSLAIRPGTTVGLIGPNGAGKSTTLKLMARILVPDQGQVRVAGRLSALLELGAGFQVEYTGRENVFLNASLLGLSAREIRRRFDEIVAFAELEEHIDAPVRTYSSGMYMRLAFAVAAHIDPEIMLVDEILAVGDELFQRKCFEWLDRFQSRGGTIVMVTHNLGAVRDLCTEAAWIEGGLIRQLGAAEDVVNGYLDDVRERIARAQEPGGGADPSRAPLEIADVRLLNRKGEPAEQLTTGEPLTVEIAYVVNGPVETPMFGVAIHRNDGLYVYGTNTGNDGVRIGPLDRPGVVRLTYSSLPLMSGTYRVTVGTFTSQYANAVPVDHHERRYSFRVVSDSHEQGSLRLEHEWSFEGPEAGHEPRALPGA